MCHRSEDALNTGTRDSGPPGTELLLAIDSFDDQLHEAGSLLATRVRLPREALAASVARIRAGAETEGASAATAPELFAAIDELDAAVNRARRVPLTGKVSMDRHELYDLIDRLREAFPFAEARWQYREALEVEKHGPAEGRRIVARQRRATEAVTELLSLMKQAQNLVPAGEGRGVVVDRLELVRLIERARELTPVAIPDGVPDRTSRVRTAMAALDRVGAIASRMHRGDSTPHVRLAFQDAEAVDDAIAVVLDGALAIGATGGEPPQ